MVERLESHRRMIGVLARVAGSGEVGVGDQAANVIDDPVHLFLRFGDCIKKQYETQVPSIEPGRKLCQWLRGKLSLSRLGVRIMYIM